jgi:hypothetical protein
MSDRFAGEYVLPLRWADDSAADELTTYLEKLSTWIDVTVVDGSAPALFDSHAGRWAHIVRHLPPDPRPGGNGKVAGVMTGVARSRHERVILGDDDVRYERSELGRMLTALEAWHVVRPQNYFTALPWHARWDTGRTLVNRAFGSDYPGTLGVRRSVLLGAGGYDGDVLFENLELIRTIRAAGGRELRADDIFVARRPPDGHHFLHQRVRQAYDDFAQPWRLAAELAILPLVIWAARRPRRVLALIALACLAAERGRRRAGGTAVFPATSALWAPAWLAERGMCVWIAVATRMRGGARYGGSRLRQAATPLRTLRQTIPRTTEHRNEQRTSHEPT